MRVKVYNGVALWRACNTLGKLKRRSPRLGCCWWSSLTPRLGYVVGTVTRATGAPALAAVGVAAVRDPCATDPQRISTILGLLTDSLGRYRHLVLAEAGVQEACLRVVAADYLLPDDSVVSPIVRLPMRLQPESVRVDLLLP